MEAIALIEDDEPRKSAYLKTLFQSSSGLDYLRTAVNKSTYKNPILLDALLDQRRPDLSCRKSRYEHTTSAEIVVELIDSLQEQVQIEQPGSISNNNSALFGNATAMRNRAYMHQHGLGGSKDYATAIALYEKAIKLGGSVEKFTPR